MIIHIAIYQWKQDATDAEIDAALREVEALKDKVPGLVAIYCGKNFSKWAKHYTHAIVVLAENQRALDQYRAHPDHELVAKKIEVMEHDGIGIDFISNET